MKIAFFDSGIGGLTVLAEALKLMPEENYIYYADRENIPYGRKSRAEVNRLVLTAADDLAGKNIKALVVACNTATSAAINDLRGIYTFPIIGMEPAVKPALECNGRNKRILVAATELTLKEKKFKDLVTRIDQEHLVDSIPLSELVDYCEKEIFDENIIIPYLKQKFSEYNLSVYSTMVLGCTHFPFYRDLIARVIPDSIALIDGNRGTVKRLQSVLTPDAETGGNTAEPRGTVEFYTRSGKAQDDSYFRNYLARLSLKV